MPQFPQDTPLLASSNLLLPSSLHPTVTRTNPVIMTCAHVSLFSSMHQNFTWSSDHPPYKAPRAHFSHFLTFNLTQTFQPHRFWCSSARLIFKLNFLANSDPAMSPRTPNVGVVDFGEEEIREQPRDIGKRGFFDVPAQFNEGNTRTVGRDASLRMPCGAGLDRAMQVFLHSKFV
jgi:hypothetical protein